MVLKKKMVVKNSQGLHARPAALFVQLANKFESDVIVRKGKLKVNGKSIMGILMLEASPGTTIWLEVAGPDAAQAMEFLERVVSGEYEGRIF